MPMVELFPANIADQVLGQLGRGQHERLDASQIFQIFGRQQDLVER